MQSIEANTPLGPPSRLALWAWLTGAVLGLTILVLVYGHRSTNFEQVTMAATTSVYADSDGARIHCADDRDAERCLIGARQRGATAHTVMFGNSQVHAINQYQPGEQGVALQLFNHLRADGHDLLVFSQPNANLQEHLVLFAWLLDRVKVEALVLPLVFDDMREDGIRESLRGMLHSAGVTKRLQGTALGDMLLRTNREVLEASETGAIAQTLQQRMEKSANQWLDEKTPFWAARKEARGDLMMGLYRLRNTVFGIKADTARRAIPARYANNRAALETMLAMAGAAGVRVVLYIAPIRQEAKLPYVPAQYAAFKSDMADLARTHGVPCHNWEALVPPQDWGDQDASSLGGEMQIDYMHFRASGHARLAAAVHQALSSR